jgi:hypothetical protein
MSKERDLKLVKGLTGTVGVGMGSGPSASASISGQILMDLLCPELDGRELEGGRVRSQPTGLFTGSLLTKPRLSFSVGWGKGRLQKLE